MVFNHRLKIKINEENEVQISETVTSKTDPHEEELKEETKEEKRQMRDKQSKYLKIY